MEMNHKMKVPVPKPKNISLVSRIHVAEREKTNSCELSSDLHTEQ